MKILLTLVLSVFYCVNMPTLALTLNTLQAQLNQHPIIRANFEQERSIKATSAPLISTGLLIVSKTEGLWWHQKTPFELTLRLNQDTMIQTMQNQKPQIMTAKTHPQLFQFNDLLAALFRGDLTVLEQKFTLELMADSSKKSENSSINSSEVKTISKKIPLAVPNTWQLVLTPKATPLNKIFKFITLKGSDALSSSNKSNTVSTINSIEMHDLQGDFTRIQLSNQRVTPPVLDENEQRYFIP